MAASKKSPARILRSKGLIPRDWNLRTLSPAQKGYITKQAKKYVQVVNRPDDWVSRKVGNKTAKALSKAGFPVKNQKVLIKAAGQDRVRITRGYVEFVRQRQTERIWLHHGPNLLKRLDTLPQGRLGKGREVGFSFRDSGVIKKYPSVAEMRQELALYSRAWGDKLAQVDIVAIDRSRGWEDDEDEDDEEGDTGFEF